MMAVGSALLDFMSDYYITFQRLECKHEGDCTDKSFCNGNNATCPKPPNKPDNVTECNQGTQVCQEGECKDSICVKFGLVSCFLTSDTVTNKRQLCELACQVRVVLV